LDEEAMMMRLRRVLVLALELLVITIQGEDSQMENPAEPVFT
jgi:hypothetical protein